MDFSAGFTERQGCVLRNKVVYLAVFGLRTLVYLHFLFLFPCSVRFLLLGGPHIKSAVNFMRKRKRGG